MSIIGIDHRHLPLELSRLHIVSVHLIPKVDKAHR